MSAVPGTARRRRAAGFGAVAVAATLLTSACAAGRVAQTVNQRPSKSGVDVQVGTMAIRNLTIDAPTEGTTYPKGSAVRLIVVFVNNGNKADALTGITSPALTSWGAYSSITDGDQVVAAASSSAAGSTSPAPSSSAAASSSARASGSAGSSASGSSSGASSSGAESPSNTPSGSAATTSPVATPAAPSSSAPRASQTVSVATNGRASFGVPDATGTLLGLNTKSVIHAGSMVTMTLTFARAGTITVRVPVQITTDPAESTVPASGTSESD